MVTVNDVTTWVSNNSSILVMVGLVLVIYVFTSWRTIRGWFGKNKELPPQNFVTTPAMAQPIPVPPSLFPERQYQHYNAPSVNMPPTPTPRGAEPYVPSMVASSTNERLRASSDALLSDMKRVDDSLQSLGSDIQQKKVLWDQLNSQKRMLQGMLDAMKKEMAAADAVVLDSRTLSQAPPPRPSGAPNVEDIFNSMTPRQ